MKKQLLLLICLVFLFCIFTNSSFANDTINNDEYFQVSKERIETELAKNNYKKAIKIINNLRSKSNKKSDNFNSEQKEYILTKLKYSEEKIEEQNFLNLFKKEYDVYTDCIKYTTKYNFGDNIKPMLIVNKENTNLILHFEFIYTNNTWLNIDNIIIHYLNKNLKVTKLENFGHNVTSCSYGTCKFYEYKTLDITSNIETWRDIANNGGSIRAYGQHYYKDFPIYLPSQQSLQKIIKLYDFINLQKGN